MTGRVGDLGFGFTKPVLAGVRLIGAGLDAAVFVTVAFLEFAEELAVLVGSFPLVALVVKGDFEARVVVLAVETGATVLEAGFVVTGAFSLTVVEGVLFRASLIPPLKTVPPNRAADNSVGLPESILV